MEKSLYIIWHNGADHKDGPFDSVYFHHLNQTVPQCEPVTVTYSAWAGEELRTVTVPVLAHSIETA